MHKQYLALNNLQWLISHKTKPKVLSLTKKEIIAEHFFLWQHTTTTTEKIWISLSSFIWSGSALPQQKYLEAQSAGAVECANCVSADG